MKEFLDKLIKPFVQDKSKKQSNELKKENQNKDDEKIERRNEISLDKYKKINEKFEKIAQETEKEFKKNIEVVSFNKKENEKLVLLADDNFGSLNMMEQDIKLITQGVSIVQVSDSILKRIDKIIQLNTSFKVEKLAGEMVPFEIKQTALINEEEIKKIDIAVLDIVFGGISFDNGETQILDGIDIAKTICEINKECIIVFYTGCNLSSATEEYNKIQDLMSSKCKGQKRIFFVDKDIDDDKRISTITEAFYALLNIEFESQKTQVEEDEIGFL